VSLCEAPAGERYTLLPSKRQPIPEIYSLTPPTERGWKFKTTRECCSSAETLTMGMTPSRWKFNLSSSIAKVSVTGTRDVKQLTSHAQKHFIKLCIADKALPQKVVETGKEGCSGLGYTLSGALLDPFSSSSVAYGLKPEHVQRQLLPPPPLPLSRERFQFFSIL